MVTYKPFNFKRPILSGGLYRPPPSKTTIDERLEKHIESTYLKNKEIHIMGDFNIDCLKTAVYSRHPLSKALKSMQFTALKNSDHTS